MDVPDEQMERALAIAANLGDEFAESTYAKLCESRSRR
jgi:hypothetical protein